MTVKILQKVTPEEDQISLDISLETINYQLKKFTQTQQSYYYQG